MLPRYSPLCDVDKEAYLAYLTAVNGANLSERSRVLADGHRNRLNSGHTRRSRSFFLCEKTREPKAGLLDVSPGSSGCVGDSDDVLSGDDNKGDSGGTTRAKVAGLSTVEDVDISRGRWHEKNLKQRQRRAKARAMAKDWRTSSGGSSGSSVVFQSLSLEEREALSRSRAERYRVENQLAVREAQLKLDMYQENVDNGSDEKRRLLWRVKLDKELASVDLERGNAANGQSSSLRPVPNLQSLQNEISDLKGELKSEALRFQYYREGRDEQVKKLEAQLRGSDDFLDGGVIPHTDFW